MNTLTIQKKYTYNDYLNIDDEKRYEVMKGELIMVPAPFTIHQKAQINLAVILSNFVREKKLGKILVAPTDVVLAEDIVVQPDILYISNNRLDIIKEAAIMGSPDLVIEIVSPSSASYDTIEKREIYEKYGVKEYWLVFPQEKAVEVLTIEKGIYKEFCKARKTGIAKSKSIEGLTVDIKEIFEG
ncbi:MAG: hypothetical protein A2Z50_03470 [Nitrospirae bacterium RBG_19FT_COMBO_42_15]|nr:MAG: hypothetical protein A2Z50_03470 [Nitrospirae bacterium RBG_19FT_COMBO_42_15]